MIDISAVGSKIYIKMATGDRSLEITEFSDEGTPFECPDVDVSTNAKNLNGQMISSRTPSTYSISVTVIPNSYADAWLTKRMSEAALQPGNVVPIEDLIVDTIQLTIPNINGSAEINSSAQGNNVKGRTFTWANGRMKSGPTGPSTSAEGRLAARTFVFEMEKFTPPSET